MQHAGLQVGRQELRSRGGRPSTGAPAMHACTQVRPGRWLAAIDIAGEMYHGYFTSEENAVDAVVLAGLPAPAAAG